MLNTSSAIGAIFLLCHAVVVCLSGGTRCHGGRTMRGVSSPDQLNTRVEAERLLRTASCCDDDDGDDDEVRCHGGYLLGERQLLSKQSRSIQASSISRHVVAETLTDATLSSHYAQGSGYGHERRKRSIGSGQRQCTAAAAAKDEADCVMALHEMGCCSANVSVFYPISAVSVLTGETVHVIQAPPVVLQAVIFGRCETDKSRILDADCQQVFTVEMMYVAKLNATTREMTTHQEPVLVESGCSCRMNHEPLEPTDGTNADDALAALLTMW